MLMGIPYRGENVLIDWEHKKCCVSCHIWTFIPTATTKYGHTSTFFVCACLWIHILHL